MVRLKTGGAEKISLESLQWIARPGVRLASDGTQRTRRATVVAEERDDDAELP